MLVDVHADLKITLNISNFAKTFLLCVVLEFVDFDAAITASGGDNVAVAARGGYRSRNFDDFETSWNVGSSHWESPFEKVTVRVRIKKERQSTKVTYPGEG